MTTYIGFSTRTNKFMVRIICYKFKHCAPVIAHKNKFKIYQFTKPGIINIINLTSRDIEILKKYGWVFIKYDTKPNKLNISQNHSFTCVQFTKKFCKIQKINIQTPYKLYRYIQSQNGQI